VRGVEARSSSVLIVLPSIPMDGYTNASRDLQLESHGLILFPGGSVESFESGETWCVMRGAPGRTEKEKGYSETRFTLSRAFVKTSPLT